MGLQPRFGIILTSVSAAAVALTVAATDARAQGQGIEACGDIHVEANAECEVIAPGVECTAECTPISFEAACAAELTATCDGECELPTVECEPLQCEASCMAECDVMPAEFSCEGHCSANCQANCSGQCESSANKSECEASCKASCSGSCDAECDVEPGSVDCEAKCSGSCQGGCRAEGELDCQIECQSEGYVDCKAELMGGCEAACETEEGALFCDGDYVDHGGNLDECVNALKSLLKIEVEGYASAECSGNTCEAEAGGSATCQTGGGTGGWMALLIGLAFAGAVRRRRR